MIELLSPLAVIAGIALFILLWKRGQTHNKAKTVQQNYSPESIERAMTLVLVYGAVLEKQGAQGGMLCPESVLPAPKETIRAALRLMAMYHIVTGDLDEPVETSGVHGRQTWRNALSVGYMALASFVPDAISARESDWRAFVQEFDSMNTEQQNERLLKGDLYIPTEDYDKSTSEAKRLLEEFSEFLRRLEELQAKKASSPQPV